MGNVKHLGKYKYLLFLLSLKFIEQDGRGEGGCGVHLSPWIHQEYTFRQSNACRTPAESGQEYLATGKAYIKPCKTQQDEGTRGKNRSVSRTAPALDGLKQGSDPDSGAIV